jgi:deoxyadenosine/deoxycytidine kinase
MFNFCFNDSSPNYNTVSETNSVSSESFKPRLVSVEGNIGAGKSTLIEKLQKKYNNDTRVIFMFEPVKEWESLKDEKGKNMLEKFYENPTKYAFAFQIMAFNSRLQIMRDTIQYAIETNVEVIVMERSLDADFHIFAKMLYEEGCMEKVEFEIYSKMASYELNEYGVDGIIWLDTDYEECFERIQVRAREGESNISLRYLNKCGQYHTEWLGADTGYVCRIDDNTEDMFEKINTYLFG